MNVFEIGRSWRCGECCSGPVCLGQAKELPVGMVTMWPPGLPFYQVGNGSAEGLDKRIEEMSNGRIRIRVYPAKELVPAFETFDAVSKGTAHHSGGPRPRRTCGPSPGLMRTMQRPWVT